MINFLEEYPGWDLDFTYMTSSQLSFPALLSSGSVDAEFNGENYKKCDLQTRLTSADKILFVVYDSENVAREEMEFSGVSKPFDWFARENLLRSSLWDIQGLSEIM